MIFGMVRAPLKWERWAEARELLLRSVERTDDVTIEDVEAGLETGKAQLWAAFDGRVRLAGITQLLKIKSGKQCFIWQLGGEWDHAPALLNEVTEWARAEGCSSIEGNMRPGFEKRLNDWRKVTVTLRKDL